jgi:hypothetical protein
VRPDSIDSQIDRANGNRDWNGRLERTNGKSDDGTASAGRSFYSPVLLARSNRSFVNGEVRRAQDQSALRATTGSTRAARRAGTQLAAAVATPINTTIAP